MTQDEALVHLCSALLQDPEVVEQQGWQKLVLIGEVGPGMLGMHGYSYDQEGKCLLIAPSMSLDPLARLHGAMKAANPSGRGWLRCMIRLARAGEVGADFEYDDANRWSHTPANYKERIREYAALPV